MKIQFLGGAGTVTGSKYLLSIGDKKILVDCGLYQGVKNLRQKNWDKFPVEPSSIDAILLTHAHIDHSGYIPAMRRAGFRGTIFCSSGTFDLCKVLLPNSGYLQEEDARYANKKKFSKHSPALPLYTEEDAIASLRLFKAVSMNKPIAIENDITATFTPVGHILGASAIQIKALGKVITFSGDVGRSKDLVMKPPQPLAATDYLVVESTYGDRKHEVCDSFEYLEKIINETSKRGGVVLIPSFAVGRAQINLHVLQLLKQSKRIPNLPIFLNSPMAISATQIYNSHQKEHLLTPEECQLIDDGTRFIRTPEESIELNASSYPSVIVSASGMASGGRVLHHLKSLVTHHRNSIVFIGYQAPGTRGAALVGGATQIKVHGEYLPVKAAIHHNGSLSAHGDYEEIIDWLKQSNIVPKKVFVTHGERTAADSMRLKLKDGFGWNTCVPEIGDEFEL